MAVSTDADNGPSPSRRGAGSRLSGTAVVLAVAMSAAVILAGAAGAFTAPVAATAVAGACLVAAISTRHARPLAELLPPLPEGLGGPVVIDAPRASEVAGHAASHTDAA